MRFVPAPQLAALTTFDACVSTADASMRSRYDNIRPHIAPTEHDFDQAVRSSTLHQFSPSGAVGKDEMKCLYEDWMVGADGPGRDVYNQLIVSAPSNLCLLCGFGFVGHLDHHLPKSRYPALAVTPLNLVPVCRDCNTFKGQRFPQSADKQMLHPYYDNATAERWLQARVTAYGPLVEFTAEPPAFYAPALAAKVRHHFNVLKLALRFSTQASSELTCRRSTFLKIHQSVGATGLQDYLNSEAQDRAIAAPNSWQTATYFALTKSDWFCDAGVSKIPGP